MVQDKEKFHKDAAGLNPYEVLRREAMDEKRKDMEEVQNRLRNYRGDALIAMLLKDEKALRVAEKKKAALKLEEEANQRNLGGHNRTKKVIDYIRKVTTNHVEVCDPTGKALRIDPSKITVQKRAGFGLGRWSSSSPAEKALVQKNLRHAARKISHFETILRDKRRAREFVKEEGNGGNEPEEEELGEVAEGEEISPEEAGPIMEEEEEGMEEEAEGTPEVDS